MNIAILTAKYDALTRLVAYYDESANWIETRAGVALAHADQPDPLDSIDELTEILQRTGVRPSCELIKAELQAAVEAHPGFSSIHQSTVRTAEELNKAAEDLVRLLQRSPRRQRHRRIAFLQVR